MNVFSIIIIIATIAAGLPAFFHTPYSYRKKYKKDSPLVNFYNKKPVKAAYFAFFVLIILVCSEMNDTKSRGQLYRKQREADSLIAVQIEESRDNVTAILGKYGFKLDSANQLLVKIRDKPVAELGSTTYPDLIISVSKDSIANEIFYYTVHLTSLEAKARLLNLTINVAVKSNDTFTPINIAHDSYTNIDIPKDKFRQLKAWIYAFSNVSEVAFYFKGSYQAEGGRVFPIDEMILYSVNDNASGNPSEVNRAVLTKVFKTLQK